MDVKAGTMPRLGGKHLFQQKPWTVTELLWSVRDALDVHAGDPALEVLGADLA